MNIITHRHHLHRSNWLRAAVLGANDGIVSTAALLIGLTAAGSDKTNILLAGVAALVAGAMSMAAGEYVSVSSQADTEAADLALERESLRDMPQQEQQELAGIYVQRGLEPGLAQEVARQLTAYDALAAHARDEIGLTEISKARPLTAAAVSAVTFATGAALPLGAALVLPLAWMTRGLALGSLLFLALLGAVAAHAGGASPWKGALRVCFWSAAAMGLTALVGSAFG